MSADLRITLTSQQ